MIFYVKYGYTLWFSGNHLLVHFDRKCRDTYQLYYILTIIYTFPYYLFIHLILTKYLEKKTLNFGLVWLWSIEVSQAHEDSDNFIVNTDIQTAEIFATVIIIGEDTDLLILLTAIAPRLLNYLRHETWKRKLTEHVLLSQVLLLLFCSCMNSVDVIHPLHSIPKGSWYWSSSLKRTLISVRELFLAALYSPNSNETSLEKICLAMRPKSPTNAAGFWRERTLAAFLH